MLKLSLTKLLVVAIVFLGLETFSQLLWEYNGEVRTF